MTTTRSPDHIGLDAIAGPVLRAAPDGARVTRNVAEITRAVDLRASANGDRGHGRSDPVYLLFLAVTPPALAAKTMQSRLLFSWEELI